MSTKNNTIENFLQSACRFISTEEKAKDLQDELRDHIYSYIEEYSKNGMSTDAATTMALKQIGDPDILSKSFRDKIYKHSKSFRIVSIILLTLIFIFSDFVYFSINNYITLEGFLSIILTIIIFAQCVSDIVELIRIVKKDNKLSKEEPLFYIQSYKQSIWDEKALKYVQIFYLLICLVLFISLINKFSNIKSMEVFSSSLMTINSLSFVLLLVMNTSLFNPKRKNAITYNEGILMFNSFVPYSSISGYMWTKEVIKGKPCYSLEFATKKTSFLVKSPLISADRAPIKDSSSQVSLLNELFKSNNIHEIKG